MTFPLCFFSRKANILTFVVSKLSGQVPFPKIKHNCFVCYFPFIWPNAIPAPDISSHLINPPASTTPPSTSQIHNLSNRSQNIINSISKPNPSVQNVRRRLLHTLNHPSLQSLHHTLHLLSLPSSLFSIHPLLSRRNSRLLPRRTRHLSALLASFPHHVLHQPLHLLRSAIHLLYARLRISHTCQWHTENLFASLQLGHASH